MDLETLKQTARKDLPITDEEKIDQESYKNQTIKQKWLDYKSEFELLLIKSKTDHQCNASRILRKKLKHQNHIGERL